MCRIARANWIALKLLTVEQLGALQLADAKQQARTAELILLGGELDLVHRDERGPLLELFVDRLEDLRDAYRRLQLVFDGDAPEAAFRTAGALRVERRGRVITPSG